MKNIFVRGRTLVGAAVFAAATLTGGCDNLKENLLEAPNPNNIDPSNVQSAAGANAVRLGALARLRTATGAAESTWLFGGLLADEWSTSSTFIQNDEADERQFSPNNGTVVGELRRLAQVITASNQAIQLLTKWDTSK